MKTNKKARDQGPGLFIVNSKKSSEEDIMIAGTVGQNRRIHDLATGATFPCIKSTNKIIILFGVHTTFTLGTPHLTTSSLIKHMNWLNFCECELLHKACQLHFNRRW